MPDFYFAQINAAGVAFNILHTDEPIFDPSMIEIDSLNAEILGMKWTGSEWEPAAPITPVRRITRLAFRSRFTRSERIAIEWAAVDRADVAMDERLRSAALRSDLKDQEQAQFIDLDEPQTVDGVRQLVAFGLLTAARADEILGAPITEGEKL